MQPVCALTTFTMPDTTVAGLHTTTNQGVSDLRWKKYDSHAVIYDV
ncbi:hypothetical protein [Jeotgalibacillus alimentarius]|nr:hypothetical protein [Jeotgalibacillus alimentarius]